MKNLYIVLFLLFSSFTYSQSPCPGLDSINYSGQWYHTVQIGTQCWLKENLNVGTMKPAVKDQINNDTIEKFCYNNNPDMCDIYGGLYQWREAMQYTQKSGARGICPIGWHIPSTSEFDTLFSSVGQDGNALKEIGQGSGTNISGFSAMLSGINTFTSFVNLGINAYFLNNNNIWVRSGDFGDGEPYINYSTITNGMPVSHAFTFAVYGLNVRCIKDNAGLILQSPYGSEIWQVGSSRKISWGGDLVNKTIRIEYSTDKGINWLEITGSASAIDGSYNWTIPNSPSKYCKVKIIDVNNINNFSISDTLFTIYTNPCPAATIEYGGQKYNSVVIAGKCWLKENVNIGTMIPGSQQAVNNGIIEKYCYNDDTANCSAYGGLYLNSETTESGFCPTFWHIEAIENLFAKVIYDGNALKEVGQGIGFGSGSNTSGFSALLAGYRGTDGTFQNLGITADFHNYYIWDLSNIASFISWSDHFEPGLGYSYRCVRDDVGPLLLTSPKGGENWQIGTTQKITWALSDVINIKIDYTTNNGTSWLNIVASTPTSTGSYNWVIPNTPSTNCKVKITSTNSADTNNVSNTFRVYQVPTNPCPGIPTINYAGQSYNTITIGDQCWLRENLNIGTMIDSLQNQTNNGIIEKYCYNNDSVKCSIYGGLYQWDEAMQYSTLEGARGICPTGWHIPTRNEFNALKTFVGGNGNDLKEVGQGTGSGTGTNASGFSALLAGTYFLSKFGYLDKDALFWTSAIDASNFQLIATGNNIFGSPDFKVAGNSIRCINDSSVSALPVELTSFTASIINSNVLLNWNTATEINCLSYEVEKKTSSSNTWQRIASIQASGNSNSPRSYSYIDKNVSSGNYNYRLRIVDVNGTYKYSSTEDLEIESPVKFSLAQNYPNPWNPTTTIRYQLPINTLVTIKLFDVLGKEVITLVNEVKPAGKYEVTLNSRNISSGIYYYQMRSGNFCETKKLILIK